LIVYLRTSETSEIAIDRQLKRNHKVTGPDAVGHTNDAPSRGSL
jgi:hypothetical protein